MTVRLSRWAEAGQQPGLFQRLKSVFERDRLNVLREQVRGRKRAPGGKNQKFDQSGLTPGFAAYHALKSIHDPVSADSIDP